MIVSPALAAEQYADWVVDLVPGARELHDSYLGTLPALDAARAAHRDRVLEANALRSTDPHSHDLEDAQRRSADAQRALDRVARVSDTTEKQFKRTVDRGRGTPDVRQEAARRALEYHARASAALAELEATIDHVDAAWHLAGSPGRSWRANVIGSGADDQRVALVALRSRLESFDVQRVTEATEGAEVPTEAHGEALARELAKTSTAIVLV
ncbi:hypothetical protein GRS96_12180 [Rathayibacter sp. VKM Ac-2803]|uniref:hypothetical protein n=1 Tax=Rathayibacter sp. VKM Ac-2803 TaxID=2609256 RepID=UPI00135B4AC9|nr:hypothetical protein [Rathayibacter sp. VKM Ac-2803]MWV50027.1 hypothetical protein [Rathayibacter sp. VKM Ac-2803]